MKQESLGVKNRANSLTENNYYKLAHFQTYFSKNIQIFSLWQGLLPFHEKKPLEEVSYKTWHFMSFFTILILQKWGQPITGTITNPLIYKDTVPWLPYTCTFIKWTLISWEQETHPHNLRYTMILYRGVWTMPLGMMLDDVLWIRNSHS